MYPDGCCDSVRVFLLPAILVFGGITMTLNDLSSEQQDLVRLALDGKNVLCDACIGSGKTSTINVLCNEFDSSKEILYLTYNRLLKLDAQEKILNDNVTVQNYHGFASKILYRRGIKNVGQGEQIGMVLKKRVPVGHFECLSSTSIRTSTRKSRRCSNTSRNRTPVFKSSQSGT